MASQQPFTLPTEIWIRILESLKKENDLADAWMVCRQVSTAFRDAVESIFRERHLSKTWIVFMLGEMYNDDDERVILDVAFDFDRLSADKSLAIFKADPGLEQYHEVQRSCLKSAVDYPPIVALSHTVQIRRIVKDTPIPGLSIDYENWELTCNWRALYTYFFGEEKMHHDHLNKWVKEKEAWAADMRQQMERGEINMIAGLEKVMHAFADGSEDAKMIARRARIRRQYKEKGWEEPGFEDEGELAEEKAILETLKDREFYAGFEKYSDDEDEPEEAEDEEGGSPDEEDEWEDEDEEVGEEVEMEDENTLA